MTTAGRLDPASVRWGPDGLVPSVVQDPSDGRVLMVAWMDAEALAATQASGLVHFHSRSRGELWQKGATSGNVLHLRGIALDCDADTLLVSAIPTGPVCHRGSDTCFEPGSGATTTSQVERALDADERELDVEKGAPARASAVTPAAEQGFAWLEELWATIAERAATRPEASYTARLVGGGPDVAGRKVAEEATEVLIAAKNDALVESGSADAAARAVTRNALAGEAADLLYHLLVLLAERGLPPTAVLDTLRGRHRG